MVVEQKLKEAEITEQVSFLLTKNLLRIAVSNISYIRGLFPEKYFNDKTIPELEMTIKKLMPLDADSRRLIDWMEKGVFDALAKKYLKELLFCICEEVNGPMIEEYSFSFSYSNSDGQEVSMDISQNGNKKTGKTIKCNSTELTSMHMRRSACKMVRTLVQLMRTLEMIPEERTILMKLMYYDDVTPADYEPPMFKSCTEDEGHNSWTKSPLIIDIGNVNSNHFMLALKLKSVLDSCEDENDDVKDDKIDLSADSVQGELYSETETEENKSQRDQYFIDRIDGGKLDEDATMVDEDETEDTMEYDQQLGRIKEWITSRHINTIELTDVLSNFPNVSMASIEDIIDKMVKEGTLQETGRDVYTKTERKVFDFEFDAVKEETDCQFFPNKGLSPHSISEDHLYMKALYNVLPLKYITAPKLHTRLGGEASQASVRKILEKMTKDGFVEQQSKKRLGKRVIHSDFTDKKLAELKEVFQCETKITDASAPCFKPLLPETHSSDMSTCGKLHSIGSDITRMNVLQNSSLRSGASNSKNTPTSEAKQVGSRESFAPGKENNNRANGNINEYEGEGDMHIYSNFTKYKRSSLVQDPLKHFMKRAKTQAP